MIQWLKKLKLRRLLADQFESVELRNIFRERHGIDVGLYSYGCFDPSRIPRGTRIGRFCSFAPTVYILNGNHGIDFLALHPYLYNVNLGLVEKETIERSACVIEDDVWLGHNAVVLPRVKSIGRGAVIAAGAVVTSDVPAYAIVAGNPARVLRYRFDQSTIEKIEKLQWWTWSKEELARQIRENPELVYRPSIALHQ